MLKGALPDVSEFPELPLMSESVQNQAKDLLRNARITAHVLQYFVWGVVKSFL